MFDLENSYFSSLYKRNVSWKLRKNVGTGFCDVIIGEFPFQNNREWGQMWVFCAASFKNLWCEPGYIPFKDEKRCRELIILIKEESIDTGSDYNRLFHLHVVSSRLRSTSKHFSRNLFKRCFSQSLSRISSSSPKTFEAVPYAVKSCVDDEQMS